jgi:hypothetical protein
MSTAASSAKTTYDRDAWTTPVLRALADAK